MGAEVDGRSALSQSHSCAFAIHLVDLSSTVGAHRQKVFTIDKRKWSFG